MRIGRKFFNHKAKEEFKEFQVWPGYFTALNDSEVGPLLNVEVTNRFIRHQTAFDAIKQCGGDKDKMNEELVGRSVVCLYNQRAYKVEAIEFGKSPKDTFKLKDSEEEKSFLDYYREKYNQTIKNADQPLLKHTNERTGLTVYLVPELCYLSGITDNIKRTNARDINRILFKGAKEKVTKMNDFFAAIRGSEKCRKVMTQWGVELDGAP